MPSLPAVDPQNAIAWFFRNEARIIATLTNILAIDTSLGKEEAIFPTLEKYVGEVGFKTRREAIHPEIRKSPSFSPHPLSNLTGDRQNLRAVLEQETPSQNGVLFNCHIDVVPKTKDFPDAFSPQIKDGKLYGRGACDTKNNLVMVVEAIRYIQESGLTLSRPVALDMPIEEEIGGNGTLSTILHGLPAQEVIVLEPTNLAVYRGHRGCLTFGIQVKGKAVHMGDDASGVSAIKAAIKIINDLEGLEARMLEKAKLDPDFNIWPRPLQLNVGLIEGGEWPGSVPELCKITCNLGFLPDYSMDQLEQVIRQVATNAVSEMKGVDLKFDFACGLRNDAYVVPKDNPLAQALHDAANNVLKRNGNDTYGWRVSCDGRLYDKAANVPAVIFGPGHLADAHSAHENIEIADLARGVAIIADFLTRPPLNRGGNLSNAGLECL